MPDTPAIVAVLRSSVRPPSLESRLATVQVDPSTFDFTSTLDVEILESVIEQDRAQRSLELGLGIDRQNYHVYVAGASGTGKRSQLRAMLDRVAPRRKTPPDVVYVHNFQEAEAPVAITLKAGHGERLRNDVDDLLAELRESLPKAFHGRTHQEALQRAVYEGNQRSTEAFHKLRRAASELGFEVRTTGDGEISMAPIVDGEAITEKDIYALPEEQRHAIEATRERLEPLFTDFLQASRDIEHDTQDRLHALTRKLAATIGKAPFGRVRRRYRSGGAKLGAHFDALYEDYCKNLERFLPDEDEDREPGSGRAPDPFVAFRVKVVVDNQKQKGAPVIFETHPTFYRMFGKIERRVEQGIYFTDHTMIRAGSLMLANGGFLVCHAADLFQFPGVWENLKSSLRNREVAIEDLGESAGLLPTSGLKPEPIPINFKLVLIGSNTLYHSLYRLDDDFRKIFQVKADFDDEIRRSDDALHSYVRFIATAAHNNKCVPLGRAAVAAVIGHGSRLSESQRKLTLRFNAISNLLVEASYHARIEGAVLMEAEHIHRAVAERAMRSSMIADKMHEDMVDGLVLLESEGQRVGVVNGLAVLSVGEHEFGRPFRVTARVFSGSEGVVNIEHEVDMSGELHDKGVQILMGLLGDRFAQTAPLAMTATVTFEQSYGAVDGDSASSTWLFAILSALSGIALDQGIGVTGSINQLGEIQPVGGVNHKVEGFFRFCKSRGLTGRQGIMLPAQNIQHLMLEADVRAAIDAGEFHVWPIRTIEEGISILTGVEAGERDEHGNVPPDTVMGRVVARLETLRQSTDGSAVRRARRGGSQLRRAVRRTREHDDGADRDDDDGYD